MSGDFSFLKGNIYTIILCSLYGPDGGGDKYGYEIAREIKERTDNKYEIKQPTLYAYLKKLEQNGQIESYWGTESNGGRRRYYKLTPKGRHDCQQFIAEWEYHKSVLSTLVDAPATPIEVSQEDVTPLFAERQRRAKPSAAHVQQMNAQDELSRQLDALIGGDKSEPEPGIKEPEEEPERFDPTKRSKLQQSNLFDTLESNTIIVEEPEPEPEPEPEEPEEQFEEFDDFDDYIEPPEQFEEQDDFIVEEAPAIEEEPAPQPSEQDNLARFNVQQDSADEFMQKFEERAKAMSAVQEEQDTNENYQHILMKMIGDQLDDMKDYDTEQQEGPQKYYTDHPVALEDVADGLAKEGIRLRIYNHASSNFKSKTLMPLTNVLCKTAWITFAVAALYFGILLFTSISLDNWQPFAITLAVVALLPISLTIYALYDPSRKEKPRFMFTRLLLATGIFAVIVILFALGISIVTRIELNNYVHVANQILIPTGLALLLPIYVAVFNFFYKKY